MFELDPQLGLKGHPYVRELHFFAGGILELHLSIPPGYKGRFVLMNVLSKGLIIVKGKRGGKMKPRIVTLTHLVQAKHRRCDFIYFRYGHILA